MKGWPKLDGNLILYFEIVLMGLFILMNATDVEFQSMNSGNVISQFFAPLFEGYNVHLIERVAWWMHIVGILIFLNYLILLQTFTHLISLSKHLFWQRKPKGQFNNLEAVTNEVKLMMDPNIDPFAATS